MLERFFFPARFPALLLAAAGIGAAAVLSFAPVHWWPLQLLALAWFFTALTREESPGRAFFLGWSFGFGWTAAAVYWLFIALHRYGGLPAWMAVAAVAMLALLLGWFYALGTCFLAWFRRRSGADEVLTLLLICPAAWALSEWVRGWLFSGFPWAVSGYAHTVTPLSGFAPALGVYGVGLMAALAAAGLAALPKRKTAILLTAAVFAAGWGLQQIRWTAPAGQPLTVRLLQGDIPQDEKFQEEHVLDSIRLYYDMIREKPADLIAIPETGMPEYLSMLPRDLLPGLTKYAQRSRSHVVLGVVISEQRDHYANSAIGIAPGATRLYRYDKHHLVPFGERIPFGFRWFVDMMRIPLADQTPGAALQGPFHVRDQWVQPNICYEDLFGEEIAGQLGSAYFSGTPMAGVLLNMSNLAWYGETSAIPQHLQISQMRALETGRPMLRATNNGATAVIRPDGSIQAVLPFYRRGSLDATVQAYQGVTPYILLGNAGPVLLCLGLLTAAWLLTRKNR